MKKLKVVLPCLIVFCMALSLFAMLKIFPVSAEQQYTVCVPECFMYSDTSLSNDKIVADNDGNPIILKQGDVVFQNDEQTSQDSCIYVSFGEYKGFVFQFYLTQNPQTQAVYPTFNAVVVAENVVVYSDQSMDNPTGITLEKGTELYLYRGYEKRDLFTAVCFVKSDKQLAYGYVLTKEIEPYGINANVITGIVVALSCITIILLLVFMKKVKTKNKK